MERSDSIIDNEEEIRFPEVAQQWLGQKPHKNQNNSVCFEGNIDIYSSFKKVNIRTGRKGVTAPLVEVFLSGNT